MSETKGNDSATKLPPLGGGIPSFKRVLWPCWRDLTPRWVFIHSIVGHYAMWAVRQSPYEAPDMLKGALISLSSELKTMAIRQGVEIIEDIPDTMIKIKIEDLRAWLAKFHEMSPIAKHWNTPYREHDSDRKCCEHRLIPHHDFIDLGALARNTAQSQWQELVVNDAAAW